MERVASTAVNGRPDTQQSSTVLQVEQVAKSYGPVTALQDATLTLHAGEIHALVGENGSGKSTFVKIVSGTVEPDSGILTINGHRCHRVSPAESQQAGALTVHQDGSLFPDLTVAQNLFLGMPSSVRPAYHQIDTWARARLADYGLSGLDPRTRASALAPGDRQLLEIVRALLAEPALLLLDEATSALDAEGVDRVLGLMRQAADSGTAVLFVTHRLSEVFRVAHRISVLRDGGWQGTFEADQTTPERLVEIMAGVAVEMEFPPRPTGSTGPVLLTARGLRGNGFGPVDLDIHAGEIVGLAGADGNGQRELLRGLAALGAVTGDALSVDAQSFTSYHQATDQGVVVLSDDRKNESLFLGLTVRENLSVGVLDTLSANGLIHPTTERRFVEDQIDEFGIRVASSSQPITDLSGGNQQKVALSRTLATNPKVLLIEEPTQGVDVRSRMEIYRMLRTATEQGLGVVVVSSDASELAGLVDRIVVVSRGQIVTEMPGPDATEESIVSAFAAAGSLETALHDDPTATDDPAPASHRRGRLAALFGSYDDLMRIVALAAIVAAIGIFATIVNPRFASTASLHNVLLLIVPLVLAAVAQFSVLMVRGIDVSVGVTMALSLVVLSFLPTTGSVLLLLPMFLIVAIALGATIGLLNAGLVEGARLTPVIATIATFAIASGIALYLRPIAGGFFNLDLIQLLNARLWIFPWSLLLIAPLLIAGDWLLWRTGPGLRLRIVGLNPDYAIRMGVNARRVRILAYITAGTIAGLAGIVLAAQVGVGDATAGNGYTLLAIAAPILGGASLLGGRGSLIGCLIGAALLAVSQSIVPMLGITEAANFLLIGALTLIALLAYSRGTPLATLKHTLTRQPT